MDWSALLGSVGMALGPVGSIAGTAVGAVANAVTGSTTTGNKGTLVGGQVISSGGGKITVRTTSGKTIVIARKQHRRRYSRRSGNSMNGMLKQALQYKMLAQAMK